MSRITKQLHDKILRAARNRCGYCQTPQRLVPVPFEIEHILPQAKGGTSAEENLWLACPACNSFKHAKTHALDPLTNSLTEIFNPRQQLW